MANRGTRWYRKNEAEVMQQLGFSPVPNSGAGWISKEDGENGWGLCQLKSTDRDSISIKLQDINVLETHAAVSHKIPVFSIQYIKQNKTMLLISPEDLPKIAAIIMSDEKEREKVLKKVLTNKDKDDIITTETVKTNGKVIRSSTGGREDFYKEKEKQKLKWKKK